MNASTEDILDNLPESKQLETPKHENFEENKIDLPYGNSVFYKSILGLILTLSIFGFIYGLYLMNIAFKRSSEMLRDYKKSPNRYTKKSLERVRTGRKIAWITLVIWLGQILAFLIFFP